MQPLSCSALSYRSAVQPGLTPGGYRLGTDAGDSGLMQTDHPLQVCPLLLRVFPRRGGHHRLEEFAPPGEEPDGELTMYTWPDATLRELTDLVKEVRPAGF